MLAGGGAVVVDCMKYEIFLIFGSGDDDGTVFNFVLIL